MKTILSILLLSLHFSFAQVKQIAVITNPEIGPQSNAMNLIEVVEDINKRQNIVQVVVIGNITSSGKIDEFIWAQEILDALIVPYFVVGGENDYLLSEGKGSEISLFWGDDKQIVADKNFSLVGLNTMLTTYSNKKYITAELLSWLDEKLISSQVSKLMTFSYYPLQSAINSNQFFEKTLNMKIFSFVGKEDKSFSNKSMLEGLYVNRKEGWGYLLVSTNKDSIHIKKILSEDIKKKVKPEIVRSIYSKSLVRESKEPVRFGTAESIIWSFNKNKTTITSSVNDSKNIYCVSKNGLVLCLDYSGKEIWRFESNEKISNQPTIENELLVIASDDGDIITINKNSGSPHQIIGIGEEITSGISVIDLEEQGTIFKSVIVGTVYGNLYCYELLSLDPIWVEHISEMSSDLSAASVIISSENNIFFYDNLGTIYCRSANNGLLIWKIEAAKAGWRIGGKSKLTNQNKMFIKDNDLFLIDDSGDLYCVDALLGMVKWDIKNIFANGIIRTNKKQEVLLPTAKNKIVAVSTKLGKVTSEIEFPVDRSNESITDLLVIKENIFVSFSDGWVYRIKPKLKAEKFFRGGLAPVISLTEINGNCLVTDYDGRLTLLRLSP